MPLAAESHRAVAQLVAGRRKDLREHRLRRALRQRDRFLAPLRAAVGGRVKHDFPEVHGYAFCTEITRCQPKGVETWRLQKDARLIPTPGGPGRSAAAQTEIPLPARRGRI